MCRYVHRTVELIEFQHKGDHDLCFVYLNFSEGVNWRLNAKDSAFDGKVRLGINDTSSSYNKIQRTQHEQHDGENADYKRPA
jgi:hypothetical protein